MIFNEFVTLFRSFVENLSKRQDDGRILKDVLTPDLAFILLNRMSTIVLVTLL